LVTPALRNLEYRTQARKLKKGQVYLSQHVAVNDRELVQRPGVEAANLLPARKTEVDENQRLRAGRFPRLFNEDSLEFLKYLGHGLIAIHRIHLII
jgi:hypothetical protein